MQVCLAGLIDDCLAICGRPSLKCAASVAMQASTVALTVLSCVVMLRGPCAVKSVVRFAKTSIQSGSTCPSMQVRLSSPSQTVRPCVGCGRACRQGMLRAQWLAHFLSRCVGFDYHGRYKIAFERHPDLTGKGAGWLKEMLARDMVEPGACEAAIFPDPVREVRTAYCTVVAVGGCAMQCHDCAWGSLSRRIDATCLRTCLEGSLRVATCRLLRVAWTRTHRTTTRSRLAK